MPEPITLLGIALTSQVATDTIGTIVGGILGNRSDTLFCNVCRTVYDRLKNQSEPVNHDIQRAVREAYLKATLLASERLLHQKYNWIDRRFHLPTYDLKEVVGHLKKQLKSLRTARFVAQVNPADTEYARLLQPNGQKAQERTGELKQQLRESLLRELAAANLCVEDDLKAAILSGWTDEGKPVDWYELMCAFFAEELKTNSRLSSIIQTELLLELQVQAPDVDWSVKLLEQQAAQIGEAMQPLVERFDELMTQLDKLLVQMDKKVDQVQKTVEAGNDFNRDSLTGLHEKVDKLQPQTPARNKYLNAFAHYDLANFVERKEPLEAIDAHFASHDILLLRGMGGIGKTTLAKAYLARSQSSYDHLAYVEIVGSIADSMLIQLGNSPDVAFTPNPQASTDEKFKAIIETLGRIPNLLLVLDNANDADDLKLRQRALESLVGKVLITGRARPQTFVQERKVQEIKKLTPAEALQLFKNLYSLPLTEAEEYLAESILEKAFYHPKLIEVIAKAAYANSLLQLTGLQKIVEQKDYEHAAINYPVDVDDQTKAIYRILLDLFDTDHLSDDAKQLLRYFAVLPTIDVPIAHLVTLLHANTPTEQQQLQTALQELTRLGWLDDANNRYFSMHGLIQWVVREQLRPTPVNCQNLMSGVLTRIHSESTFDRIKNQIYLKYVKELPFVFINQNDNTLASIYTGAGLIHGALGNYNEAVNYHKQALLIRRSIHTDNLSIAESLDYIGIMYNRQGLYTDALGAHLQALDISQSNLNNPLNMVRSLNNIGVVYLKQAQYRIALEYLCKALRIVYRKHGTNHPETARALNNIGNVYKRQKLYDKALKIHIKTLNIRQQTLKTYDPDIAKSLFNIGTVLRRLGRFKDSLFFHQKALKIRQDTLGDKHIDTIKSRKWTRYVEHLFKKQQ